MSYKAKIAARAAQEIQTGMTVNLGIGLPVLIMQYLPKDARVMIHSENGILGMSGHCTMDEADPMRIDAGGSYVNVHPGASYFDSALSFAIIRGGRLDIAFLGTLEVAGNGDLANWIIPGKYAPGIGGGMELAQKARRLVVTTTHCTRKGEPKILKSCTLPLTAKGCVDIIITELAVIEVGEQGLILRELAQGVSLEEVLDKTEASLDYDKEQLKTF